MGEAERALLEALLAGVLGAAVTVPWLALAAVQGTLQRRGASVGLTRRRLLSLTCLGEAGPAGPSLRAARLWPRCRLELTWPAPVPEGFTLVRLAQAAALGAAHYRCGDPALDAQWRMGRQGDLAVLAPEVRAALQACGDALDEISGGRLRSRAGLWAKDWPARRASLEAIAAAIALARADKALTLEARALDPAAGVRQAAARLLTPGPQGALALARAEAAGALSEATAPAEEPRAR